MSHAYAAWGSSKSLVKYRINEESFTVYPHDILISFPENKYILTAKKADYKNTTNTLYSIAVEIDDYFLRFCDSENKEDMEFAESKGTSAPDDAAFLEIPEEMIAEMPFR